MRKGLAALICLWMCQCSEPEPKKESLNIASPITVAVGDTTPVLVVSRTTISATGRLLTEASYVSYGLVVTDTAIAKVADLHRVVGRVAGMTSVKALDEKSNLVSESVMVMVVGKK